MKILHLYSDWKWTGPAEPAIQMCKGLEELGHDVTFACRATPSEHANCEETVAMKAAEYGIDFTTEFGLNRYWGLKDTTHDLISLPAYIRKNKIDVVHTHLSHDHAFGLYASKLCWPHRHVLVKTMHRREIMDASFWNNRLVKNLGGRNGLMVFTEGFRQAYSKRFHISVANIAVLPMPLDLARFRPDRSYVDQRPVYDIPADSPVIGIVARFQKYRRMDVFMEAARKLVDMRPNVQFMVIGRSGQMQETVINPMEKLGLKKHVVTPGYLIDNYLDVLQTLNVFTLMMPGFDGTARALREAMAVGKPCVASNFGMLPDIVQHNETGMIFELTDADALAQCWLRLIDDSALAKKMGDCAAAYAHRHFRIDLVGSTLEKFYKTLAGNK